MVPPCVGHCFWLGTPSGLLPCHHSFKDHRKHSAVLVKATQGLPLYLIQRFPWLHGHPCWLQDGFSIFQILLDHSLPVISCSHGVDTELQSSWPSDQRAESCSILESDCQISLWWSPCSRRTVNGWPASCAAAFTVCQASCKESSCHSPLMSVPAGASFILPARFTKDQMSLAEHQDLMWPWSPSLQDIRHALVLGDCHLSWSWVCLLELEPSTLMENQVSKLGSSCSQHSLRWRMTSEHSAWLISVCQVPVDFLAPLSFDLSIGRRIFW